MRNRLNQNIYTLIKQKIDPEVEELWGFAFNSHLQMISMKMIFRGTTDFCLFHPRDIFRFVLLQNASFFVVCHNHPSDESQPSNQDIKITEELYYLSLIMNIPLLDHLIITSKEYFSFAESHYFAKWRKVRRPIRKIHHLFSEFDLSVPKI